MKKITEFWRNLRLKAKFVVILLLAIALVSVTALLSLGIPQKAYDERLYESSAQMITLFSDQIATELRDFEAISYRILTDNALQESLSIMKRTPPGTTAWVRAQAEVANRMAYFSLWFSNTVSFQLKTRAGTTYSHFFGASVNEDRLTPERLAYASGHIGRLVWRVEDGDAPKLFLLREIREIEGLTLDTLGTMLIEVDFKALVETYLDSMAQRGTPLLCAIYKDDVCLYASNDAIREIEPEADGYVYMKLGGQDVLCVYCTGVSGMQIVTLVDYTEIRATVSKAVWMTIATIAAATLLALAISTLLINSILRHLWILLEKFDSFGSTARPIEATTSPYQTRQDEIGKLHRHFDRMTRAWDRMTRDKEEQQRLLQEKQMQQLRAQVRPHFLYNTLESIYCLAQNASDERIATMTDALGKMLRASLSDKRDIVTLGEDLQVTREYLRIQLIRYGDRLRVEYDVDEALQNRLIPAMTIQPLVENAVHHAAEEMLDTCVIRISAHACEGCLDVVVEDNGPGMDEDILAKLESGEVKPEGLGIGMRNIHRRVQYAFSDSYGLRVKCEDGHTRIIVHLPDTHA